MNDERLLLPKDDYAAEDSTLRAAVFPARPTCLLLIVPTDAAGVLRVPPIQLPFTLVHVAEALGSPGCRLENRPLRGKAHETRVGHFGPVMDQMLKAERDARITQQHQREATQAALLRHSNVASIRERSEVLLLKRDVDAMLVQVKAQLAQLHKESQRTGRRLHTSEYRALEEQLEQLRSETQALAARSAELRREEVQKNAAAHRTHAQAFMDAAKRTLDTETFQQLLEEARAAITPDDDEGDDE